MWLGTIGATSSHIRAQAGKSVAITQAAEAKRTKEPRGRKLKSERANLKLRMYLHTFIIMHIIHLCTVKTYDIYTYIYIVI